MVPLRRTALVLPETYPRFTLVRQAWGAAKLGHEALSKLVPEVCERSNESVGKSDERTLLAFEAPAVKVSSSPRLRSLVKLPIICH